MIIIKTINNSLKKILGRNLQKSNMCDARIIIITITITVEITLINYDRLENQATNFCQKNIYKKN